MKRLPLTTKEKKAWGFILGYVSENEYSPTVKEIALAMGSENHQTGLYFVQQLIDKGHLKKEKGKWRNIKIKEKT